MRELAISDIHGCLTALDTLWEYVAPEPDELVVLLGDYVDRGPDTRGVIDRVLELGRSHSNLITLRGNHELMMLDAKAEAQGVEPVYGGLGFWTTVGGFETLQSYAAEGQEGTLEDVPLEHWHFIEEQCALWHETQTHIYVHAAVDPQLPLAAQDEFTLCWQKLLRSRPPHVSGKTVVCGHTAQPDGLPVNLGHLVCIDTWVYGEGWLTCLDAATGQYWQANQQGETRESVLKLPR